MIEHQERAPGPHRDVEGLEDEVHASLQYLISKGEVLHHEGQVGFFPMSSAGFDRYLAEQASFAGQVLAVDLPDQAFHAMQFAVAATAKGWPVDRRLQLVLDLLNTVVGDEVDEYKELLRFCFKVLYQQLTPAFSGSVGEETARTTV